VPALVHVCLAAFPVPAVRTATDEVVEAVGALAAVLAGLLQALVDVLLAEAAPVPGRTLAAEPVDFVHAAGLVEAGVGGALVHVHLALGAIGAGLTVALKKTRLSILMRQKRQYRKKRMSGYKNIKVFYLGVNHA
jgi:hypothetical protein